MNDNWTDFEKYVFEKLEGLDRRLTTLEVKALMIGGAAGLFVTILTRFF